MKSNILHYKNGYYFLTQFDDTELSIVALFLHSDVGNNTESFRSWIVDDRQDAVLCCNVCCLDKEKNEIIIWHVWDEDIKNTFKLTKQQLLDILDRWDELLKQQPKEIHIYKKDGEIILEGKN